MRLINARTFKLVECTGKIPPYAILSHTWGSEEVSFEDFRIRTRWAKRGITKIEKACAQARRDGLEYLWVDTCCIVQSSSAELGEAINSMYKWYQRAEVCYAFLEDYSQNEEPISMIDSARSISSSPSESLSSVTKQPDKKVSEFEASKFARSRWFTRGWTLQELIAPRNVEFFDKDWSRAGDKKTLTYLIHCITGIDGYVLQGGQIQDVSVGQRMSWAAGRQTTRIEDIAYCLLGIFNVNMPLLYGEGARAFMRLQEQILQESNDQTLFAWRADKTKVTSPDNPSISGLLAHSPDEFANFRSPDYDKFRGLLECQRQPYDNVLRVYGLASLEKPIIITNRGLRVVAPVLDRNPSNPMKSIILSLNCSFGGAPDKTVGLYLERIDGNRWARVNTTALYDADSGAPEEIIYGFRSTDEILRHNVEGFPGTLLMGPADQNVEHSLAWWVPDERRTHDFIVKPCAILHAIYLPCTWIDTELGNMSVQGLYVLGEGEHTRPMSCHNISPGQKSYLLIKISPHARVGILLRSQSGTDCIVVVAGLTQKPDQTECSCTCWSTAQFFLHSTLSFDPRTLTAIIKGAHRLKSGESDAGSVAKFTKGSKWYEFSLSIRKKNIGPFRAWVFDFQGVKSISRSDAWIVQTLKSIKPLSLLP